jgi:hypothetical protein
MSEDPERAFPGTRVVSKQIKSNQILASLRRGPPEERRGRRELDTARRAPFRKRASRQPQTRQSGEGISGNVPLSVMAADSDPHRRTHRTTTTWELFPTNRIFSGAAYESGAKEVERWAYTVAWRPPTGSDVRVSPPGSSAPRVRAAGPDFFDAHVLRWQWPGFARAQRRAQRIRRLG